MVKLPRGVGFSGNPTEQATAIKQRSPSIT
jgi:hypothetical protein